MTSRRSISSVTGTLAGILVVSAICAAPASTPDATIVMPDFPLPALAVDPYGGTPEASSTRLLRDLFKGGVRSLEVFETVDTEYVLLSSRSLGLLSAWLEAACKSIGVDVARARTQPYNGVVYAEFLEVATSIAANRKLPSARAIPIGVMICRRRKPWGALPGDGARDAYVLIATEHGFVVYDPPTRQCVTLANHPNNSEVLKVRM